MELVRATFGEQCEVEVARVPLVPREPSGKFRYYRPASAEDAASPLRMPPGTSRQREDRLKMV